MTLVSSLYAYLQLNPIEDYLYRFFLGAISYLLISAFSYGIFYYLFYFLNLFIYWSNYDELSINFLNKMIPLPLLFALIYLLYEGNDTLIPNIADYMRQLLIALIIALIILVVLIILIKVIIHLLKNRSFLQVYNYYKNNNEGLITAVIIIFVFLIVIFFSFISWQILFNSLTNSSYLQGGISIDLNDKYRINDSPIPALIQVTGSNNGIIVILKSEFNQNYDSTIQLDKYNESMVNKSLNGRIVGKGRYKIFINTTGMSTGIYDLKCIRQKYSESYSIGRFSLENN